MKESGELQSSRKLEWALAHNPGPLAVVLVDFDGDASHAVAITEYFTASV